MLMLFRPLQPSETGQLRHSLEFLAAFMLAGGFPACLARIVGFLAFLWVAGKLVHFEAR